MKHTSEQLKAKSFIGDFPLHVLNPFCLIGLLITITNSSTVGLPNLTALNLVTSRRSLRSFAMMIPSAVVLLEEDGISSDR